MKRLILVIAVATPGLAFSADSPSARPGWLHSFISNSHFLSAAYTEDGIGRYFFQKSGYDDFFRKRYFVNASMSLGLRLYSWAGIFSHLWELEMVAGMGQTWDNVVFDPKDIEFAAIPIIEFRVPRTIVQLGLDHRCFHEIDRKDFPTKYYNRLFLGAGSPHYRMHDMRKELRDGTGWLDSRRFSWYSRAGWYLTAFPGLRDSTKINFNNLYGYDVDVTCRYAVISHRVAGLYARGRSMIGALRSNGAPFWRQDVALECDVAVEHVGGFVIFVEYTRDRLPLEKSRTPPYGDDPRLSKDGLLQVGARFSN